MVFLLLTQLVMLAQQCVQDMDRGLVLELNRALKRSDAVGEVVDIGGVRLTQSTGAT
jgi:hypothetical protein